ncbi:DUF3592 domain-containing protein [Limimaricola sp.]|uniref:DUF3592 domain-containing protein n=1 Tax=Limimaricola sp. TaxID=2211665 RepID=UPI0025BC56E6|nr:DUF3592 domain-containing protein [Limimaricola sp.]
MPYPKRSAARMFWAAGGWGAAIALAMGVAFGAVAVTQRTFAQDLDRDGVKVMGTLSDLTSTSRTNRTPTYTAHYYFQTPDENIVSASQTIGYEDYYALQKGAPIEVTYLPADPAKSEVVRGRTGFNGWILMLISAVFLAGGVVWGWVQWGRSKIEVALREHGEVRRAQVVAHEVKGKTNDKPTSWVALWRDETGAEGKTLVHKAKTLPAIGAALTVYADPKGGAKAVWEGDVGTR